MSDTGFIVTNAHVVDGARDVDVTLRDSSTYKAVVVGESRVRDLAILKIDADNLKNLASRQSYRSVSSPLQLATR